MLLVFGILFESVQGFFRTALVYELGILGGALTHSLVWAYRPLIGCSHGVYGIYGACAVHIMWNIRQTNPLVGGCMGVAVGMQIISDIMSFYLWFNQDVGYAAHMGGFFTGLLVAFSIANIISYKPWKLVVSVVSFLTVGLLLSYGLYRFETVWPPEALIRPTWSPVDSMPCCAEAFEIVSDRNNYYDQATIEDFYYCNGLDLEPY